MQLFEKELIPPAPRGRLCAAFVAGKVHKVSDIHQRIHIVNSDHWGEGKESYLLKNKPKELQIASSGKMCKVVYIDGDKPYGHYFMVEDCDEIKTGEIFIDTSDVNTITI